MTLCLLFCLKGGRSTWALQFLSYNAVLWTSTTRKRNWSLPRVSDRDTWLVYNWGPKSLPSLFCTASEYLLSIFSISAFPSSSSQPRIQSCKTVHIIITVSIQLSQSDTMTSICLSCKSAPLTSDHACKHYHRHVGSYTKDLAFYVVLVVTTFIASDQLKNTTELVSDCPKVFSLARLKRSRIPTKTEDLCPVSVQVCNLVLISLWYHYSRILNQGRRIFIVFYFYL